MKQEYNKTETGFYPVHNRTIYWVYKRYGISRRQFDYLLSIRLLCNLGLKRSNIFLQRYCGIPKNAAKHLRSWGIEAGYIAEGMILSSKGIEVINYYDFRVNQFLLELSELVE